MLEKLTLSRMILYLTRADSQVEGPQPISRGSTHSTCSTRFARSMCSIFSTRSNQSGRLLQICFQRGSLLHLPQNTFKSGSLLHLLWNSLFGLDVDPIEAVFCIFYRTLYKWQSSASSIELFVWLSCRPLNPFNPLPL